MTSSVLTEDNVSKHILAFTRDNFLFTCTVCKAWYKNGETNSKTSNLRAVDSPSTLDEAFQHEYPATHAPFMCAFDNNSDISVFEHLVEYYGADPDWEEVGAAAEQNRIDVLKLFRNHGKVFGEEVHGQVFDESVLYRAVQGGQLNTVEYLMGVGCPADSKDKVRSMEIAVGDGRIDIVKQLRTVDYPFNWDTFAAAINGKDIDMLKYLKENADGEFEDPYDDDLSASVVNHDYESVKMLLDNDLVDDYGHCIVHASTDYSMIKLLELYGCRVCETLVDNAILDQHVELARHLVEEYNVFPTSYAYRFVFQDGFAEDVDTLNWLHDELGLKWDPKDPTKYVEGDLSPVVRQWFYDRRR